MNENNGKKHPYSRVMKITVWVSGAVGAALGGLVIATMGNEVLKTSGKNGILFAPVIFGALGTMVGMSYSFLFAPTSYLESDDGQEWLKKVGTKSIKSGRIACGIMAALATTLFVAIAIGFINEAR